MALSYTAPRFEPEDVQEEYDALDDATKEQLKRDLYGIDTPIEESPKLIETSVSYLREELHKIIKNDDDEDESYAFCRARDECSDYVNSEDFLVPFLRAERFDITKTAERIVVYWDEKLKLFGDDHTFGPLTINDLQESDLQVIRDGGFAWMPNDAHGRAVLHGNRGLIGVRRNGRDAILRALFYIIQTGMEGGVSVQQKGMVMISASASVLKTEDFDRILFKRGYKALRFLPLRNVATHVVHNSSIVGFFLPYLLWLMGPELRSRNIIHCHKSDHEMKDSFASYGITGLPPAAGGKFKFDADAWIEERRKSERNE